MFVCFVARFLYVVYGVFLFCAWMSVCGVWLCFVVCLVFFIACMDCSYGFAWFAVFWYACLCVAWFSVLCVWFVLTLCMDF